MEQREGLSFQVARRYRPRRNRGSPAQLTGAVGVLVPFLRSRKAIGGGPSGEPAPIRDAPVSLLAGSRKGPERGRAAGVDLRDEKATVRRGWGAQEVREKEKAARRGRKERRTQTTRPGVWRHLSSRARGRFLYRVRRPGREDASILGIHRPPGGGEREAQLQAASLPEHHIFRTARPLGHLSPRLISTRLRAALKGQDPVVAAHHGRF